MEENTNTVENVVETNVEGTGVADNNAIEEKKYSESEAQKMIDSAIAKKLKNMPTKDELKEFANWKQSKATEEEAKQSNLEEFETIKNENAILKNQIACMKSGVAEEFADYVMFSVSKMDGDFEDNLKSFLEKNPQYSANKITKPQTTGSTVEKKVEQDTGVHSRLKSKYPNLYK